MTRWLCCCQYGHSRSVALARVFHGRGEPAVACGVSTAGDALPVLAAWADRIAVLQPQFRDHVPPAHQHKVVVFDVGPDRWVNPYHPELREILTAMVEAQCGASTGAPL